MATKQEQGMETLTDALRGMGLDSVPNVPDAVTFPQYNQIDIFRSHIAELLAPITGAPASVILPALQWTIVLEHGDLVLPVPALRLKGRKPDEIAKEIQEKVHMARKIYD